MNYGDGQRRSAGHANVPRFLRWRRTAIGINAQRLRGGRKLPATVKVTGKDSNRASDDDGERERTAVCHDQPARTCERKAR